MKWSMQIPLDAPAPKRGDLLQANVTRNGQLQRTWFVLKATRMKTQTRKYMLLRARWWELEPDMRMRLFTSAERHGGQRVWNIFTLPRKKADTFEQFMRRTV